jgi:rhodanese-related sulfurtransferase
MNTSTALKASVAFIISAAFLISCTKLIDDGSDITSNSDVSDEFATWDGSGPDKWATIWLISRFVNPNSKVKIVPENTLQESYTYFDIPNSTLNRNTRQSSFEVVLDHYQITHPEAKLVAKIIHDIDIRLWQGFDEPMSHVFDEGFRSLQQTFGRDGVHTDCYMNFFDNIASLAGSTEQERSNIAVEKILPDKHCHRQSINQHLSSTSTYIPEIPIDELLSSMSAGLQVTFVDVRETQEYTAGHIPGAINLKIREVNETEIGLLRGTDLVIAYCVKDFRGFEMAKKLKQLGIQNVALLKPYGFKGWLNSGLPVSKGAEPSTDAARLAFEQCLSGAKDCGRYL